MKSTYFLCITLVMLFMACQKDQADINPPPTQGEESKATARSCYGFPELHVNGFYNFKHLTYSFYTDGGWVYGSGVNGGDDLWVVLCAHYDKVWTDSNGKEWWILRFDEHQYPYSDCNPVTLKYHFASPIFPDYDEQGVTYNGYTWVKLQADSDGTSMESMMLSKHNYSSSFSNIGWETYGQETCPY